MQSQFDLLKTRRFFPVFLVQFLAAFNDNMFKSAMVMLITFQLITQPNQAQLLINLAGGIFILPFFLFSTIAGQLADKYDRTSIIRIIKLLEIAFMALGALGFYLSNIPLMMTTLFLMGVHSTFFGPIKYSVLPDLMHSHELLGANGLVNASTFIAILIGTILGTELGVTTQGALITSAIAVTMAFIGWISSLFVPTVHAADPTLKVNLNFLQEIGVLIKHTKKNKVLLFVILEISWFWFIGFIFVTQFPVYVKNILGGNADIVTLFLVLFSVGIAIGALLCNWILRGYIHAKYVPLGILGMTIFTLDLCWASSIFTPLTHSDHALSLFLSSFDGIRICSDLLLLSVAGGFYIVPLYSIIQTRSDNSFRSRVVACNNIFGAIFMVAAAITAMAMLSFGLTTIAIFLVSGILNGLVALIAWRKMPNLESSN